MHSFPGCPNHLVFTSSATHATMLLGTKGARSHSQPSPTLQIAQPDIVAGSWVYMFSFM
jgi:hypothetical protein